MGPRLASGSSTSTSGAIRTDVVARSRVPRSPRSTPRASISLMRFGDVHVLHTHMQMTGVWHVYRRATLAAARPHGTGRGRASTTGRRRCVRRADRRAPPRANGRESTDGGRATLDRLGPDLCAAGSISTRSRAAGAPRSRRPSSPPRSSTSASRAGSATSSSRRSAGRSGARRSHDRRARRTDAPAHQRDRGAPAHEATSPRRDARRTATAWRCTEGRTALPAVCGTNIKSCRDPRGVSQPTGCPVRQPTNIPAAERETRTRRSRRSSQ